MDVQLPVIRTGKQQLFTGVKVVPPGKVITLSTRGETEAAARDRIQLIHGQREEADPTRHDPRSDSQPGLLQLPRGNMEHGAGKIFFLNVKNGKIKKFD